MQNTLNAVAAKHHFSDAKDLLGAIELHLLDEGPTVHASDEALSDTLDILAPRRSNRIPAETDRGQALWAVHAAFNVL